jgi:uncharacterized protein (TIGR03437 family)
MIWAAAGASAVARAAPQAATARLQLLPGGRALLNWVTGESGTGAVLWRAGDGPVNEAPLTARELRPADTGLTSSLWAYTASLNGLPRDATITYQLQWNGVTGEESVFLTPGPRGQSLTFLAVGDSGTGGAEQLAIARRMSAERDAAFVLHTGDLAYPAGSYADLREGYLRAYSDLMGRAAFFPCPGNHEYYTQSVRPYQNLRMGGSSDLTYYAVDYGPLRIISVDSNDPMIPPVEENAMLQWLDEELSRNTSFWRIVIYHHPPYTAGMHINDDFVRLSRERLTPLMDKHAVPLVLNGHEHLYQRSLPVRGGLVTEDGRGTVYITTGGGGGPLYPYTPHALAASGVSAHHYLKARAQGGRLTVTVLGVNGEVLDRVEIAPRPDALRLVNAADLTPRLAPGSLALLSGAHLTWGPPPRLYCGEQLVEVLDAQPGQLEFQVPPDAAETLRVRVETANGSGFVEAPLAETAPALFTLGSEERVAPGAEVALYATGLGRWPEGEGAAWIHMLVGDVAARLSAEPDAAPGSGVYRLRFVLPADLPEGEVVVRVKAGTGTSGGVKLQVGPGVNPALQA